MSLAAMARVLQKAVPKDGESVQQQRKLVAEFCKFVGEQISEPALPGEGLAPRLRQTLHRLLAGDSEKQVALRLGVSPNTIHVYVKSLYRHYEVCSRGELLARFVRNSGNGNGHHLGDAHGGAPRPSRPA